MSQADRLERRQLVDPCEGDRRACDPAAAAVPREDVAADVGDEAVEAVGSEAEDRPDREVGEDEHPCRNEALAAAGALARDAVEHEHHRRRRGEHHRRHHGHPRSDVPAERAEVGAGPGVHSAHPADGDDPRDQRRSEHERRSRQR
jgi:hypothetical protein